MNEFPDFMKNAANRIATASQATPGAEGYGILDVPRDGSFGGFRSRPEEDFIPPGVAPSGDRFGGNWHDSRIWLAELLSA